MADDKFWRIRTKDEFDVVTRLLDRRCAALPRELSRIFDEVDPFDIVYPGNPDEYADVVREFLVAMHGRDLHSADQLRLALRHSFAACMGEPFTDEMELALVERMAELDLEAMWTSTPQQT